MATFGEIMSWALLATTHEARDVARMLPEMVTTPSKEGVKLEEVILPTIKGVATPEAMIQSLEAYFGKDKRLVTVSVADRPFYLSPWLANKVGNLGGGEVQLYAETLCQLYPLLTVVEADRDVDWGKHLAQWSRGHRGALTTIIKGEVRSETNAGFVKKALRGKGVYAAKIGAWSAKWKSEPIVTPDGSVVQAGYITRVMPECMYVSSDSPLARLSGKHIIRWRNPMVFLEMSRVVVVGDKTSYNTAPDVYTPGRKPLPTEKVFFHPLSVSKTAGDVDGDGIQFFCVEELVQWCLEHPTITQQYPRLWEGLLEHFVDLEAI
jgi:hypothetical protein